MTGPFSIKQIPASYFDGLRKIIVKQAVGRTCLMERRQMIGANDVPQAVGDLSEGALGQATLLVPSLLALVPHDAVVPSGSTSLT
jgi:hypothetical protein